MPRVGCGSDLLQVEPVHKHEKGAPGLLTNELKHFKRGSGRMCLFAEKARLSLVKGTVLR